MSEEDKLTEFLKECEKAIEGISLQYGIDAYLLVASTNSTTGHTYNGGRCMALGLIECAKSVMVNQITKETE